MSENVNGLFTGHRASVGVGFFLSTSLGLGTGFPLLFSSLSERNVTILSVLGAQWTYTHPISAHNTDDTKNFQFGLYVDFM